MIPARPWQSLRKGLLWAAMAVGIWATPGHARCELALVLALDVSSSVDAAEYALQRDGLARALQAPEVVQAILSAGPDSVHITAFEWSGRNQIVSVLDWTALTDAPTIQRAADRLHATTRRYANYPTAIGYALGHAAVLLDQGPPCWRKVIDVSGDGIRNDGFQPRHAYAHFPFEGVTVNGLAVLGADPIVDDYYRYEVRYGPGAFVETAQGYLGYESAMRRKLFREINGLMIGQVDLPR